MLNSMKKYFMIKSLMLLFFLNALISNAQPDYNDIIDTAILNKTVFRNIKEINTRALEFSPAFFDGGLVYVTSQEKPGKKRIDKNIGEAFFRLKFAALDSAGNITAVEDFSKGLNIKNHLGPCTFNEDETIMFLSRNKKAVVEMKGKEKNVNPMGIYIYKYENSYWIYDSELPVNSYGYKVFHPAWDERNQRLIFASDMPGGYGGTDLYSIEKTENGWHGLKNLGAHVNTPYNEAFPFIFDSHYLFYASNKPEGNGGFDIYLSIEDKKNKNFGTGINLGKKFNSSYDDFGLILDKDALSGYFTSSKPEGLGKDDIYGFYSQSPVFNILENYITITIKESSEGNTVPGCRITFATFELASKEKAGVIKLKGIADKLIYDIDPGSLKESASLYSDEDGICKAKLPEGYYILKVRKEGYIPFSGLMEVKPTGKKSFFITLTPEQKDTFEFGFLDTKNNNIIRDVELILPGNDYTIYKKDNAYILILDRGVKVNVDVKAKGYKHKKIQIEYGVTPSKFDVLLEKEKNYVDFLPTETGQVMVLKNIYYGYNKADLTSKAKKELDKLAIHLKEHPHLKIELSSYTDSRGKKEYNMRLSQLRSLNAKKYLVSKGISPERIIAKGYGETGLKNGCKDGVPCSEKEHAKNRRTEVKVID